MSIEVPLEELAATIEGRGALAYLVSVGGDGRPRVVSASVVVVDGGGGGLRLAMEVGRHTASNVDVRPSVTVLWPPPEHDPVHTLLVDGAARIRADGAVEVVPTSAILHRIRTGRGR